MIAMLHGLSVCPAVVHHNFKDLFRNHLANQSQTSCGASFGKENECLKKWFKSHDQDGNHHAKNKDGSRISGEGG